MLPAGSDTPKQVSIATTLLPWRKDDYRAKYLGYLACGFSTEEALYMLGLKENWLDEQRQDNQFATFELSVPEIRKELSKEYIEYLKKLKKAKSQDKSGSGRAPFEDVDEDLMMEV